MKPTWKNTLCMDHMKTNYGNISLIWKNAHDLEYEYFIHNDIVHKTHDGMPTAFTKQSLNVTVSEDSVRDSLKKFDTMQMNLGSETAMNTIVKEIFNG